MAYGRVARSLLARVLILPLLAPVLLPPAVARAQGPASPPPASPPPVAAPAAPLAARFTLPNGVVVLVAERPALPIVVARVAVEAGAVLDPPDKPGLANLTALLLPRGTRSRSGPEIDRAIEFVGGSLEADGGRDWSELGLSVLRRDLGLGLDLLADVLLHPTFPADEFERTREEVRASIRRSEEDPEAVAGRLFRRLGFPNHPYARPVTGTEESLGRITREDVRAFYAATYRPAGTVVVVVGDVTVGDVLSALAARLGAWRSATAAPAVPGLAPLGTPPRTEMVQKDLSQATVYLGQATVTRPHPDVYPLVVASHLLGGGSSSRLYTRVREERGLAYTVFAHYAPQRLAGMLLVGIQSENGRVREVLALVREELVRLRRERVAEEELARARAYLVGSFPLRMDTNAELAALLVSVEQLGLGLSYPAEYRRGIEAVTADDVHRAVSAHWNPDLMSLAIVGNLREAGLGRP
jgi:zinc protease